MITGIQPLDNCHACPIANLPTDILIVIFKRYFSGDVALTCKRFNHIKAVLLNSGWNAALRGPHLLFLDTKIINQRISYLSLTGLYFTYDCYTKFEIYERKTKALCRSQPHRMPTPTRIYTSGDRFVHLGLGSTLSLHVESEPSQKPNGSYSNSIFSNEYNGFVAYVASNSLELMNLSDLSTRRIEFENKLQYVSRLYLAEKSIYIKYEGHNYMALLKYDLAIDFISDTFLENHPNIVTKLPHFFIVYIPAQNQIHVLNEKLNLLYTVKQADNKTYNKNSPPQWFHTHSWMDKWILITPSGEISIWEVNPKAMNVVKRMRLNHSKFPIQKSELLDSYLVLHTPLGSEFWDLNLGTLVSTKTHITALTSDDNQIYYVNYTNQIFVIDKPSLNS